MIQNQPKHTTGRKWQIVNAFVRIFTIERGGGLTENTPTGEHPSALGSGGLGQRSGHPPCTGAGNAGLLGCFP